MALKAERPFEEDNESDTTASEDREREGAVSEEEDKTEKSQRPEHRGFAAMDEQKHAWMLWRSISIRSTGLRCSCRHTPSRILRLES